MRQIIFSGDSISCDSRSKHLYPKSSIVVAKFRPIHFFIVIFLGFKNQDKIDYQEFVNSIETLSSINFKKSDSGFFTVYFEFHSSTSLS